MIANKQLRIGIINMVCILGLVILVYACNTVKNISPFQSKEYINIEFLDNNNFKFYYYEYNDFDNLMQKYCKGHYFRLDSNIYILKPDYFNNTDFDIYFLESQIDTLKDNVRLKMESGVECESGFKTRLFIDKTELIFNGAKLDTVLNYRKINQVRVEISLTERLQNGNPTPTFKSIATKEIQLNNNNGNFLYLKIPVTKEMFYYKNEEEFKVKEFENHYYLFESKKQVEKRDFKFDCD